MNNKIRLGIHLLKHGASKKRLDYLRHGIGILMAGVGELIAGV